MKFLAKCIMVVIMLVACSPCFCAEQCKTLNNDGVRKMNLGDVAGAIADFTRAIEADPSYQLGFKNRAVARNKLHDYAGALADYDEAVRLKPRDFLTLPSRAILKRNTGDFDGAINDYTGLIKLARSMQTSEKSKKQYEYDYLCARAKVKAEAGNQTGAQEDRRQADVLLK